MSMVYLHLIPELLEDVESAMSQGLIMETHYPIGLLIVMGGFFFMYLIEELVHTWAHRQQLKRCHHHHQGYEEFQNPSSNQNVVPTDTTGTHSANACNTLPCVTRNTQRQRCDSIPSVAVITGCDIEGLCQDTHCSPEQETPRPSTAREHHEPSEVLVEPLAVDGSISTLRSVLVVLALSVHGCLEGLSLGLESTNQGVWLMFGALTSHKVMIAFSVGMELLEKGIKLGPFSLYMIIFCLASPVGGSIGVIITNFSSTDSAGGALTFILLNGLSAGTILYVVFCEILERERSKAYGRIARYLSLLIGFILMACLLIVDTC